MPLDIKITIHGLNDALRAVSLNMAQLVQKAAKAGAEAALPILKQAPAASRKRQPFRSAKSRRFFFAALKSGQITVPYRRTGQTVGAWDYRVTGTGADLTNDASAVPYVYNPQVAYHKGVWPNEQTLAERAAPAVQDAVQQSIEQDIQP